MSELEGGRPSWLRWAETWLVVFLVGAAWTVLTVPRDGMVASLIFFGLCCLVTVGMARDSGSSTSWSVVPMGAVGLTAMLGPLFDVPLLTLPLMAAMAATTPPVRGRMSRRRARLAAAQLSDWGLEAQWDDSEAQLHHTDRADQALAVVLRREEILDELVRRGHPPYDSSRSA